MIRLRTGVVDGRYVVLAAHGRRASSASRAPSQRPAQRAPPPADQTQEPERQEAETGRRPGATRGSGCSRWPGCHQPPVPPPRRPSPPAPPPEQSRTPAAPASCPASPGPPRCARGPRRRGGRAAADRPRRSSPAAGCRTGATGRYRVGTATRRPPPPGARPTATGRAAGSCGCSAVTAISAWVGTSSETSSAAVCTSTAAAGAKVPGCSLNSTSSPVSMVGSWSCRNRPRKLSTPAVSSASR